MISQKHIAAHIEQCNYPVTQTTQSLDMLSEVCKSQRDQAQHPCLSLPIPTKGRQCSHAMLTALQITCVNVRSYGLVTMPLLLPASLESLWVGTKARGRRLGPSLLMPKASELPSVKVGKETCSFTSSW